jgi:hypothetical protein
LSMAIFERSLDTSLQKSYFRSGTFQRPFSLQTARWLAER